MLVAPVSIVSNSVLHKLSNKRKHVSIANARNESIDCSLAKVDIVFFLIFTLESLLRPHPALINLIVDVDHQLEDLLEDVLGQSLVFLHQAWLALNHGDHKLERLVAES